VAGRIVYLEVDDEITSAAARIRDAEPTRIAVVLPNGSRVATSRINFRLLSRDALTHEKRLSIVSGDPATRALAASAGLPVFSSVAEYESSLVGLEDEARPATVVPVVAAAAAVAGSTSFDAPDAPEAPARPPTRTAPADEAPMAPDGTLGLVVPEAAAAAAIVPPAAPGDTIRTPIPRDPQPPLERYPVGQPMGARAAEGTVTTAASNGRSGVRTPWLIGGAILALAVLIGGVGLYLLLPSATVVVTPRPEPVGPILLTVVADPSATVPSASPPVVPAKLVSIPVVVNDTFAATGKRVALTKATGAVRFENLDPTSSNRIASGSIVSTAAGVRFRTDVAVTVPKSELIGFQIFPSRATVKVTAVDGGPDGNVDAGAIAIVPTGESSLFLKVGNPEATSGGTSQEFARVTQGDVDGALAALNLSLQESFREAMADPSLSSGGQTVFPATGTLGAATPTVPPETLVGQEVATFTLGLSATGTVTTVDSAPVTAIAAAQLRAAVEPDHQLVAGSVEIKVGDAVVTGQTVSFPVTVTAQQVAILDPAVLEAKILGKPVKEAKAILEPYGKVDISVSPDWAGSIPSFESRVDLTIKQAVQIETPAPSGSATP
jgi:hypothetical protein